MEIMSEKFYLLFVEFYFVVGFLHFCMMGLCNFLVLFVF